jgi:hypothetical protein
MKIKLKEKPEQIALIKAMGSSDEETSQKAMKVFANLVGPLAKKVLDETNIVDSLYDTISVGEFEPRTIPLDDFYNIDKPDYVRVTFSSQPGDLAYSQLTGADDIPFTTFTLTSAIAMYRKYLKAGRIQHAENGIRKMLNEVRFKMKRQGIQPILDSVANAQTNGKFHVTRSTAANQFTLADFNRLETLAARIITSALGGTPNNSGARGITDLLMSPEMVEQIRAIAYEPMNTRAGVTTNGTGGGADGVATSVIPAPESVRESVYAAAGIPNIYGTNIIQMIEMGVGQDFNTIFGGFAGGNNYPDAAGTGTRTFDGANDEFILGINRSVDVNGLIKVEISDSESGATFNALPDNQFVAREGKVGFYGSVEAGYLAVEPRNLFAMIV